MTKRLRKVISICLANAAGLVKSWNLPTDTVAGWGTPDGDVWNTGHIEPPISGANVQSVGGNLELTKPSAADWPCVSLKFREPIQIDIQAAK
ncbi:MAG: hypothetical protein RRZ93_05010, partial [Ruthenibacterium sp.]